MKNLVEEWERSAEKYQKLGLRARDNDDPIRQEGLLCRSEVYGYCADKLRRRLQQGVQDRRAEACFKCVEREEAVIKAPAFRRPLSL